MILATCSATSPGARLPRHYACGQRSAPFPAGTQRKTITAGRRLGPIPLGTSMRRYAHGWQSESTIAASHVRPRVCPRRSRPGGRGLNNTQHSSDNEQHHCRPPHTRRRGHYAWACGRYHRILGPRDRLPLAAVPRRPPRVCGEVMPEISGNLRP